MRIRTLCIAACALSLAASISCGSDSPPACKDVPACTATPTLVAAPVGPDGRSTACGTYNPCPNGPQVCQKPVVPSAGVQESGLSPAGTPLGTFTVGQVVTFDVPAGTSSITIIEQANGTGTAAPPDTVTLNGNIVIDNTAVPDKVTNPGGNVVYDDNPPSPPPADPSGQSAFFASASPFTSAFTLPNTSTLLAQSVNGLPAGRWSFVVNDFGYECSFASNCGPAASKKRTTTYDVRVVLKGGAPRTSGTLDVAFHLAGLTTPTTPPNTTLKAADAPNDPAINRMVSSLASIYAKTGICLGTVTFYDLPDWAEAQYGLLDIDGVGPCDDLDQMFTLSAPGNHLNVFLVGGFKTQANPNGGVQVAGIDGTIPGPSAFSGTIHSGAVVNGADLSAGASGCASAFDFRNCAPDEVAYISAHEGGHWMGLYHTTESTGDAFDPIADTGKCPCSSCVSQASQSSCSNPNVPPVLTGATCTKSSSCGGGDNLMFWLLDNASTGALSCEQGGVMRANPVVH